MLHRRPLLLASTIALLTAAPSMLLGCINVFGTNVAGASVPADVCTHQLPDYSADPKHDPQLIEAVERLEDLTKHFPTMANRNNLGAKLLQAGEFQRALELLLALELDEPGHYEVASNLGTAYELTGRDVEAREWIDKGIARNIDNHYGTEWIHLRILDAKLELARDPDWLLTHSVIGATFGNDDAPTESVAMPAGNDGHTTVNPRIAQLAICYQMQERLPFTPKPNLLVGSLLFDAGNIAFHHDTLENTLKLYQLAAEYSVPDPALLERRIAHTKQLLANLAPKQTFRLDR